MYKPTLRQLEYLAAVAKHQSFHKAAQACCVSQPTLSTQIKNLEENFAVILFERNNRHVHITPTGEEVLRHAQTILNGVDTLMQSTQSMNEPLSATLRLGVIPTIAPYFLPQIMPVIRDAHPKLKLLIREEQTTVLLKKLRHGELDILLLALEANIGKVHTAPLFTDSFYCAMHPEHPLANQESIHPQDFLQMSMLLLEEGNCLRDQVWDFCKFTGIHELGDFSATSLNTLVQMVSNKLGVTLLPQMALANETRHNPDIVIKPLAPTMPFRTIGLVWTHHALRSKEYQILQTTIESALKNTSGQNCK